MLDQALYKRRCIVERSPHERWVARPLADGLDGQGIVLSKDELMRALPHCCEAPCVQYTVTAPLRVRPEPNTERPQVGVLPEDSVVVACPVDGTEWLRMVEGEYAGHYIPRKYAREIPADDDSAN